MFFKRPTIWLELLGKKVEECPICESRNIKKDCDFPETMRNCNDCGSEWVIDSKNSYFDITFNSRTDC
jgi:hypothetical protein